MKYLFLLIALASKVSILTADSSKTVCLNMIVKNESAVIERCLSSVKPFIDYWVIVDTGSSDETKTIIQNFLSDIPGELHEQPWVNFEDNRNGALALAQNKADYILFIDADEELIFSRLPDKTLLTHDFYYITSKYFGMSYPRVQLVKANLAWQWQGLLHEALICSAAHNNAILEGVFNKILPEGDRSKDPEKYIKDALLLQKVLIKEPFNTRYLFYCAQSYKDAGLYEKALETYFQRISLGGFNDEIFWSLYQIAFLQEILDAPASVFIQSYHAALSHSPSRIEPIYRLVNYYRRQEDYQAAYDLALTYQENKLSSYVLFTESWMKEYGLLIEKAFCALHLGKQQEAHLIYINLLNQTDLPSEIRAHIEKNLSLLHTMSRNHTAG